MNRKIRMIVADNVRHLRQRKNLSQEGLGDIANLHRTYIGNIERSEKGVSIDQLFKIAEALKVKPHLLLIENAYQFPDEVLKLLNKF